MTIFIHYVLNPVAYVLITSELPRLSYLQKRKKAYTVLTPNTPVLPDKKPAFARPSGTTTSATAPAAKRNTITDSSTASD